jgi:hypothetical protein
MEANIRSEVTNIFELWKAIHGGCWPGPRPDLALTEAAQEVIASLALFHIAPTFGDANVTRQITGIAAERFNAAASKVQTAGKNLL